MTKLERKSMDSVLAAAVEWTTARWYIQQSPPENQHEADLLNSAETMLRNRFENSLKDYYKDIAEHEALQDQLVKDITELLEGESK